MKCLAKILLVMKMTKLTKLTYEQEKEIIELKHKYKMEELEFERENARRYHDMELERQRIRTAEIRKSQMFKEKILRENKNV